jgi:hypothetical protein
VIAAPDFMALLVGGIKPAVDLEWLKYLMPSARHSGIRKYFTPVWT